MKPKTMILMVVAVCCGLGASYITSKLLAERNNKGDSEPTVPVLVAKGKVPAALPISTIPAPELASTGRTSRAAPRVFRGVRPLVILLIC